MAKIIRSKQKVFCDDVPATNVVAVFGSLKEGDPEFSKDPVAIQSLPAYGAGWAGATVLNQAPALQDMNALQYLFSRQIAYILQNGIAEYDATTSYYIGSIVTNSAGLPYVSLINDNLGQPLTETDKWKILTLPDLKWNAQVNYALGDVVTNSSGVLYVSIANNNLNFPLSDSAKWQQAIKTQTEALSVAMVSPVGYASGTYASPLPALFPNGVSKSDVKGSYSTTVSVTTNVACDANQSNVFNYTYRVSATRTIPIHNLASGQTITVLVTGVANDIITFNCFSDSGLTAVTVKVPAYNSLTMTTTQSVYNITRVTGSVNWAIVCPLHGLS
jgi:hypothetical protein